MTMQVGMVGTDGVLIASDTQWTENQTSVRWSSNRTKFKIDHEYGIAVSLAASMETAGRMADEIISAYRQDENLVPTDQSFIAEIEAKVLSSVEPGREPAHCFFASVRPNPKLHLFKVVKLPVPSGENRWGIVCFEVPTRTFAGDTQNSAIFWGERYYPRMPKIPIKNLIRLAAHLIVTARFLHSAGISGLEIVLCDVSGIHRVPDESLAELEMQSIERDRSVGESLLSQEVTYA
jgi:hypothetical protein